ncbi:TonB-dependent receptor family protein [Spirosoma sp. KUDC1026]|uniref:TonB-dependent receptor family protein n=1 Tax=Spirosoma sp. KUDC1026 TaxID=2745947 RepID=UPI00159BEEE4|nr:TonB-dependent receptor [Spirosoma sp. KUDC1026]QKZ13807.1 TonB-dependent receptor [Spirosoma sp. KUDC1026]
MTTRIFSAWLSGVLLLPAATLTAQTPVSRKNTDSLTARTLKQVTVKGAKPTVVDPLPNVYGTFLMGGKRSEAIRVSDIDATVAEKNPRQLFARIPGVFVYDMDGTGNQINIATRGLDAHRSWENNIRQNGVITNSDMYGYPASHYSPPMESIDRIELVRGTGSLQYGAQFGGMLNYVTKRADTTRRFGFETNSSVGSYGLRSTYNAIGGRLGKWTYYAYYYRRHSDGYRQNSRSEAQAQFASIHYQANRRLGITAELGRSSYVYQIPGPLTDSLFNQNPRQSTRSRNYFNPDIYVPSLRLNWQLSDQTQLSWTTSAVLGARNSVQFDAFATVSDGVDPTTGRLRNRQVDVDHFNSYTSELRLLHKYRLGSLTGTAAGGIQVMSTDLHRQQQGQGTTGDDFDLTLVSPFRRDLHFRTNNIALFAENQFQLTPRLNISPGIRIENGLTRMRGTITYYTPDNLPTDINHHFALLGINGQYQLTSALKVYGGWSQAYRPVIFKDIIPASMYEQIDKNLKDARGYTAELGISGQWQGLHVNVTLFDLLYRNRLGTLLQTNADGSNYIFRTNIGDSRNRGVEALIEGQLAQIGRVQLSGFTSTAYLDARYTNARVSTGRDNQAINGNRVESTPQWTSRNGLTARYATASLTLQYSYVAASFSDALNTATPSANGAVGPVPAYSLLDLNSTWRIGKQLTLRGSVNNLLNRQYFTKRPTFYPGPGVWPSDGRSAVLSVSFRL